LETINRSSDMNQLPQLPDESFADDAMLEVNEDVIDVLYSVFIFGLKGGRASEVDGMLPSALDICPTGVKAYKIADRSLMIVPRDGDGRERHALPHRDRRQPVTKEPRPVGPTLLQVKNNILPDSVAFSHPQGTVSLHTTAANKGTGKYDVLIQGKRIPAYDQGKDTAEFFSDLLRQHVRLVWADPQDPSQLPPEYITPSSPNVATGVDSSPLVGCSLADLFRLQQLNGLDRDPTVLRDRFRVNVVIGGLAIANAVREPLDKLNPYLLSEDILERLKIGRLGALVFENAHRSCYYPNISPDTYQLDSGGSRIMRGRYGTSITDQRGLLFTFRLGLEELPADETVTIGRGTPVEVVSWLSYPRVRLDPVGQRGIR
jgi:uncharacterized protein YcbX